MQVTSLLSRQEDEPKKAQDESCDSCGHDHDHEHVLLPLAQTLIGLVLVINSFLVEWIFKEDGTKVASFSAMIGAIILGYPIVWTAVKDLMRSRLSTNELVALAVLASFGSGHYQEAGVVAFFMLLGQIIETRTAEGARASIESLIKLTPTKARRLAATGEEEVPTSQLKVGDVIRIRPGDNVAADGVITNGHGSINQANITGESLPVDKKSGDEVFAGTQNLNGVLEVRVTRAGEDTTLGKVRDLILAAEKTKLPIMRIIDQYMHFYTPLILVIAALVWAFTTPHDLRRVISVLIVGCPCAFVLAGTFNSGMVDEHNIAPDSGFPHDLTDLFGLEVPEFDLLAPEEENHLSFRGQFHTSHLHAAKLWCDLIEPKGCEILGTYTRDFYVGKPAVTINNFGTGKAVYIGTMSQQMFYYDLVAWLRQLCNLTPLLKVPDTVEVSMRQGDGTRIFFLLNHQNSPVRIQFYKPMHDFLTGRTFSGNYDLPPHGVLVLDEHPVPTAIT